MSGEHTSLELLHRYIGGDEQIDMWSLEAHLEKCAACRLRLAELTAGTAPQVTELIDTVWTNLNIEVSSAHVHPAPLVRRWVRLLATWASPAMLPWIAMSVLVMGIALAVDLVMRSSGQPSLVLLLAPVAPVLGVAASWAGALDPAHEVVAGAPRAGLYLVLRRTAAVLVVAIPLLTLAGWAVGTSPVGWLLPCLAFTVGTLALGSVIGVRRAALCLLTLWSVLVLAPGMITSELPIALEPVSLPVWAAAIVLGAGLLVARAGAYNHLISQR